MDRITSYLMLQSDLLFRHWDWTNRGSFVSAAAFCILWVFGTPYTKLATYTEAMATSQQPQCLSFCV